MDAQRLRQKAEHTRALARQITDEQTRVAALDLTISLQMCVGGHECDTVALVQQRSLQAGARGGRYS